MLDFAAAHWSNLAPGVVVTLLSTAVVIPICLAVGILVAAVRLWGPRWLRVPAAVYVEVFRGTPLLLQLFWLFFALPFVGFTFDPLTAGVLGLSLNFGAYLSEIFRAGILAVPRGQVEAAEVLGFGRWGSLRRILLPQAMVIVIPPVGNNIIELFKATSLLSLITAGDIVFYAQRVMSLTQKATEVWVLVALFYFVLAFPVSILVPVIERRLRVS